MGKRFAREVQMPQSPRQSGDDERIDQYVCGRLSPQDELEFEAEFIGNPGLVKKIEEAYALKQCLVEAKKKGAFNVPATRSSMQNWWCYFVVPQTAWGAIAAILLVVPLFLSSIHQSELVSVSPVSVYMLDEEKFRGAVDQLGAECVIQIGSGESKKLIGFTVPSAAGADIRWNIELLDKEGNRLWYGEDLSADARSVIYLEVDLNSAEYDSLSCVVSRSVDDVVN
jgi:hypothetical protein